MTPSASIKSQEDWAYAQQLGGTNSSEGEIYQFEGWSSVSLRQTFDGYGYGRESLHGDHGLGSGSFARVSLTDERG